MSYQVQAGAEGSESVHFPPTSSFHEHQGYHMDGRMAMAPPLSSVSRAPPRAPFLHDDGRGGGPHYMHSGGFDRPEYEYGMRRHSCGDHLGLHSGTLIEHLLLQENQKALRMASLVQSQASGCLSGCLSCGLSDKRLRFKDSEEQMMEEQRCYSRNAGEGPSRSVNLGGEADAVEYPDGWFRQPRPRQSIGGVGERSQTRISFSEEELVRSLYQGRRISYPVAHPTISHSQASHHVQDQPLHSVGAAESSVPIYGFSDADGRVRQRWPTQRQSHLENGIEEAGWQRASRSRVGPPSGREQDRQSLPDIATKSLPRNLVGSPHRVAGDSVRPAQSTRTTSQSLALPENSAEPSYQDNTLQQAGTQRVVTQGPISLTNWYIIKIQIAEVGRVLETKVAVGGWLVQNGEHVKTSPIVNRLDIHKVVTEDGVEVSLEGTIDQETSTANGFAPGIVQCLSAGFPYMWKQLLRVRPVGDSFSVAVSESLGGLHPKASKCLSEDESQGIMDRKASKTIPEGMPCSSRDCEGDSPAPAVNEEPPVVQTPANTPSDVVESEAAVTVVTSEVIEATVTAMAGTSNTIETGALATPSTLEPNAPQGGICDTGCLGAGTARAETSDANEMQAAVIARADTSDAIETVAAVVARAETSDAIETQCSPQDVLLQQTWDASLTSLDPVHATEAPPPATEVPLPATEVPAPVTEAPVSVTEAPVLVTEAPVLVTEAPVEYLTTDSLIIEAENGPTIDTTLVTIRRGRKNKKGPSQPPLRSSRRLQQRQSSSSEFTLTMVDSLGPAPIEPVISGMNITTDNSGDDGPTQIVPDVQQDQPGREELTKTNSIIEEVLEDLQQADTGAGDQCGFSGADPVGITTDPQPMEVEDLGQVQDQCENLPKVYNGVEGPELKGGETTQDESGGVEIEEAVPIAPSLLEDEEIEESAPVTPEFLQSKGQSRVGSLSKLSSEGLPQGNEEWEFPEFGGRMTRSLKRRLKLTPITETAADVAPITRSLKRLRRFSDSATPSVKPISNPDTTHEEEGLNLEPISNPVPTYQEEGPSVRPDSNPDTPHQEEVDAFYVRVRGKSKSNTGKAVGCSNSKQPCSPQDLLKNNSNVVSTEVTPEQVVEEVLKLERVDYPPLASQHTAETPGTTKQLNRDQTETYTMKHRSGRFKNMKPANRFVKNCTSRKLLGEDTGKGSSERRSLGEGSGKGSGGRRSLREGSGKKSSERRSLGEGSGEGSGGRRSLGEGSGEGSGGRRSLREGSGKKSSERRSLGEGSGEGSGGRRSLGEGSGEGSGGRRSLGEGSGEGSGGRRSLGEGSGKKSSEGLGASSSRGKHRRTSIIPPPLPPPRVQDKSKVPEAFGLKTSRSGRLLVPPLAYWRSQSIEYDKDGGIIAIFDGFQAKPADTGCFNFTPPQEKHAKKIQERLCKAAATVKKR